MGPIIPGRARPILNDRPQLYPVPMTPRLLPRPDRPGRAAETCAFSDCPAAPDAGAPGGLDRAHSGFGVDGRPCSGFTEQWGIQRSGYSSSIPRRSERAAFIRASCRKSRQPEPVTNAVPYKSFIMMPPNAVPRLHHGRGCGRERLAWWAALRADSRNQHAAVAQW